MTSSDSDRRNRAWLFKFATQRLQPLPRVRQYLQGVLDADRPLELSAAPADRKHAYHISRGGAALIGRKAFLFRTPGTPQRERAEVMDELLAGLRVFRDRQDRMGDFALGDAWSGYLPHHEHAWRLEPLIWARVWLEPYLSGADRRWIDAMLERGARRLLWFARQSPNDTLQYCNRGVVWSAVVTLCGLYFDDSAYLKAATAHGPRVLFNTIRPDGEVLENYLHYAGGGPEVGYSFTTWAYAIVYRLLSGRRDFDDRLIAGQKWLTHFISHSGHPLASGASIRHTGTHALVCDLMHGYELLAEHEPFFDTLAGRMLGRGVQHGQGHCVHPYIWAMLLHRKRPAVGRAPEWYADHESRYEHPASQYMLVHHRYQTALVWRGLFPLKGIQTFAWGDEAPIIHPGKARSGVLVGRTDTAVENVSAGPRGWEIEHRCGGPGDGFEPESPGTVSIARRGSVWECCVLTRASVIYVAGAKDRPLLTRWSLHATADSPARLDRKRRRVTFAGRKGAIHYLAGAAKIVTKPEGAVLELRTPRSPAIFGLGNARVRLERFDRRNNRLRFRDDSGRYELDLNAVLDENGNLTRSPDYWHRLRRF